MDQTEWQTLPQAEKKRQLFLKQKHMLDQFLSTGAISEAQYQKSLSDLTVKMGMEEALRADETGQDSVFRV